MVTVSRGPARAGHRCGHPRLRRRGRCEPGRSRNRCPLSHVRQSSTSVIQVCFLDVEVAGDRQRVPLVQQDHRAAARPRRVAVTVAVIGRRSGAQARRFPSWKWCARRDSNPRPSVPKVDAVRPPASNMVRGTRATPVRAPNSSTVVQRCAPGLLSRLLSAMNGAIPPRRRRAAVVTARSVVCSLLATPLLFREPKALRPSPSPSARPPVCR